MDGCRSELVNFLSGVPKDRVLWSLMFLLSTSELFYILENKLVGYAIDSTLKAVVCIYIPLLGVRVTVPKSLNRDLRKASELCDLCGIKLNANKTETI